MTRAGSDSKLVRDATAGDATLSFAPTSYWPSDGAEPERPMNEYKRRLAHAERTGDYSDVKDPAVKAGFIGGDPLPAFRPSEVEIARISLASTTWDVISIRARPSSRGVSYRVMDDFDMELSYRPKSSRKPLRLGQLIGLLDSITNEDGDSFSPAAILDSQEPCDDEAELETDSTFVTVTSEFYPDLQPWYRGEAERWKELQRVGLPERAKERQNVLAEGHARLVEAAEEGDPAAVTRLGYRYFVGEQVDANCEKAVELWETAAALGNPGATLNLAVCLTTGCGVQRDEVRAFALYEKLAAQGYRSALRLATCCRLLGVGCEPDHLEALRWAFDLAKREGPDSFSYDLLLCLWAGRGDTELERDARAWIEAGAGVGKGAADMLDSLWMVEGRPKKPTPTKDFPWSSYIEDLPLGIASPPWHGMIRPE